MTKFMSNESPIKVVLLGQKNVGKTSIFNRFVYDEFGATSMTIGAYFSMKDCKINHRLRKLAIWDTAGEEKFDSLTSFYCRGAQAAIICYDITNRRSFENLDKWVNKVVESGTSCSIIFAGNKADLLTEEDRSKRSVSLDEVEAYGKKFNADVLEVSALASKNVSELFDKVVLKHLDGHDVNFSMGSDGEYKAQVRLAEETPKSTCC
eukprot:497007_1